MENENIEDSGILLEWEIPEFQKMERGRRWYIIAVSLTIFLIVYAMSTANFLFAIIIIMAAIIIFLTHVRDPENVNFMITDLGIVLGNQYYPYHEFQDFSILYAPPQVKKIYLKPRKSFQPVLVIPLENEDPNMAREYLLEFLPEDLDKVEESLTEIMSRVYKL